MRKTQTPKYFPAYPYLFSRARKKKSEGSVLGLLATLTSVVSQESCVSLTVDPPSLVAEAPTSSSPKEQTHVHHGRILSLSYIDCMLPASLFVNTNSTHKNRRRYSKRSIASSPTISSLSTSLAIDSNLYTIYEPYTTIIL